MSRSEDEEIARALRREREAIVPRLWLRVLYSLTLVATVLPIGVAGVSGWTGLTLGTSMMGPFLLPLLAVVLWRVYSVWRHPSTLVRYRAGALGGVLHWAALAEMVAGCLAALVLLLQRPLINALGGVRSEDGIEYYLLQLGAVTIGGLGLQGLIIFEWVRIVGMERYWRESGPAEIEEQEPPFVVGFNALALVALLALALIPAATLLGKGAVTPWMLIGPLVALPMAMTILLRIGSLLTHRRDVPQPITGGVLGVLRKLALVALAVVAFGLAGCLVRFAIGPETASRSWAVIVLIYGVALLGPLALGVLEAT